MRKIRFITLTAFCLLLLGACEKESLLDPSGGVNGVGGDIRFEIGFNQPTGNTRAATDAAFTTTWEDGDEIGLFAVSHAAGQAAALATSGNYMHNVKLTYSKATDQWTPATKISFPTNGDVLDFYAYYPYDNGVTDPLKIAFSVATDQCATTSAQPFNRSDLMRASHSGVASGTTVQLSFSHLLAMMEVDITFSDPSLVFSDPHLVVSLQSIKRSTELNLSDGTLSNAIGEDSELLLCRAPMGDANQWVYRALLPVQSLENKVLNYKQDMNANNSYADDGDFELTSTINRYYASQKPLVKGGVSRFKQSLSYQYGLGELYPFKGTPIGVYVGDKMIISLDEVTGSSGVVDYRPDLYWGDIDDWCRKHSVGRINFHAPTADEFKVLMAIMGTLNAPFIIMPWEDGKTMPSYDDKLTEESRNLFNRIIEIRSGGAAKPVSFSDSDNYYVYFNYLLSDHVGTINPYTGVAEFKTNIYFRVRAIATIP